MFQERDSVIFEKKENISTRQTTITLVSRIGGWKLVQTLIDCYGQPDEDYIIKFLTDK